MLRMGLSGLTTVTENGVAQTALVRGEEEAQMGEAEPEGQERGGRTGAGYLRKKQR